MINGGIIQNAIYKSQMSWSGVGYIVYYPVEMLYTLSRKMEGDGIMLELLLMTYKDMFGEDFPIADFAGTPEIDVINILYDCVRNNLPYDPNRTIKAEITDAPGLNK